jgi:predicted MFS family arabinose efflux permease
MFFLTALFLQEVHHDSALQAGLHFVPMGIAAIASATIGSQLVTRFGTRVAFLAGAAVGLAGLLLLTRVGAHAGYVTDLLPGLVVFGLGLPLVGVSNQIAAVADVPAEDVGAASGIITTAFQIGGALGLAIASTAATSRAAAAIAGGATPADALTAGYHRGLVVAAGLALLNLVVGALTAPRIAPDAQMIAEAAAAA